MQIGVIAWFVILIDGLWTQSQGRERSLVGCLVISFFEIKWFWESPDWDSSV